MTDSKCVWCGQETTDGREESGFTGFGPDPMIDGDFGCDASPETDENGVGSHLTRESFRHLAANVVRFSKPLEALKTLVKWADDNDISKTRAGGKGPFRYEGTEYEVYTEARAAIAAADSGETK